MLRRTNESVRGVLVPKHTGGASRSLAVREQVMAVPRKSSDRGLSETVSFAAEKEEFWRYLLARRDGSARRPYANRNRERGIRPKGGGKALLTIPCLGG